jgi:hypothetical protein
MMTRIKTVTTQKKKKTKCNNHIPMHLATTAKVEEWVEASRVPE